MQYDAAPQWWLLAYALSLYGVAMVLFGWLLIELATDSRYPRLRRASGPCITIGSFIFLAFGLAGVVTQVVMMSGGTGL